MGAAELYYDPLVAVKGIKFTSEYSSIVLYSTAPAVFAQTKWSTLF